MARGELKYRFSAADTYKYGSGVSIFFEYMIFLAAWMLIKFLLSDLPRIANANPPVDPSEPVTLWQGLSRKAEGYDLDTEPFNLVTVLALIALSLFMRKRQIHH